MHSISSSFLILEKCIMLCNILLQYLIKHVAIFTLWFDMAGGYCMVWYGLFGFGFGFVLVYIACLVLFVNCLHTYIPYSIGFLHLVCILHLFNYLFIYMCFCFCWLLYENHIIHVQKWTSVSFKIFVFVFHF